MNSQLLTYAVSSFSMCNIYTVGHGYHTSLLYLNKTERSIDAIKDVMKCFLKEYFVKYFMSYGKFVLKSLFHKIS